MHQKYIFSPLTVSQVGCKKDSCVASEFKSLFCRENFGCRTYWLKSSQETRSTLIKPVEHVLHVRSKKGMIC